MARNNVTIAEDFVIPTVSDEQIQEMMKKQQEMQGIGDPDGAGPPPPPAKKPEAKKAK